MKEFKNAEFIVIFENEEDFKVTNKFGDTYRCKLQNGVISSKQRFGLAYAMKARKQFGF